MRAAVITFPGSNCDRDMALAIGDVLGVEMRASWGPVGEGASASGVQAASDHQAASSASQVFRVWHGETELPERLDLIAVPGGFSYGDYLRAGAVAARSPIMRALIEAAERGVPVLGVCNGFQVLTEAGLLPGALMRNSGIKFVCRRVPLDVVNGSSRFTSGYGAAARIEIPVAHHDGNYFADASTLERIEGEGLVAFRYGEQVNGSANDIAGLLNAKGNVLGMMPHPERAMEDAQGGSDGRLLFETVLGVMATV